MNLRRWWLGSGVAVAPVLAYAALLASHGLGRHAVTVDDLAQLGAAALAGAMCLLGARHVRGRARRAWLALAAASGAWALGQAYWSYAAVVGHTDVPFPSPADLGYLGFPVLAAVGLMLFPGRASRSSRTRMLLDGTTVAASIFVLSWATVLSHVWDAGSDTTLGFAVSLTYPLADVVLLTFVVLVVASSRERYRLGPAVMAVGLGAMAVADSGFAYLVATGRYHDGSVVDAGWIAAFLLMGLAALAPTPSVDVEDTSVPTGVVLVAPYGALLLAIVAAVTQMCTAGRIPLPECAASAVAGLGVIGRQIIMLVENSRLLGTIAVREEQLRYQALHDPLTGLANRMLFTDRLDHALALQRRDPKPIAVAFLDLDDFKEVNDTLGHPAGDELLVLVGERITRALRGGDTVGRFGGDEFAVLLEDHLTDPLVPARRMLSALSAPFTIDGRTLTVGASIGLVVATGVEQEVRTSTTLLRDADIAMYAAKRSGKGGIEVFSPDMEARTSDDLDLRLALTRAVERDEISVVFQPIVAARTGEVLELEALARWTHPELGPIGPDRFVPLAERFHLVNALTDRVLQLVCRHVGEWRELAPHLRVAVNVTADQLADPSLPARLAAALDAHGVEGEGLTVEITETALMHDVETAANALRRIKSLGVAVAVDDFGTGYSSLARLRHFDVDVLKIDRFFVGDLTTDPQSRDLVAAMIQLAHSLGLSTVAEGVEESRERAVLAELGCDAIQGWLVSRPVTADAVPGVLASTMPLTQVG